MCGIAGWITGVRDLSHHTHTLRKMSDTLKSRGPDEGGMFIKPQAALIHRRLSVVDIENGKQPMSCDYNGEKYVLIYNGELYNSDELRHELRMKGYSFTGHSDTEVVLKSYVHWHESCAEKFNGIYAFAVYEVQRQRLFLCRDRIGVKPLFYCDTGRELLFASEIKALLGSGVIKPQIDASGLYELFFLAPARTPSVGVLKGISELLPGEYAYYESNTLIKSKYYELVAREHTEDEKQTAEHTRALIQDSINRQLVSDVPLCCFLSGGLDSSIITKTASDYYKANSKGRLDTYSVEYRDNAKYFTQSLFQPNRDYEYITLMSQFADTLHHEVIVDNHMLADSLPDAVKARDLPAMADIDSSLLLFCREVKKDFTVALSGECADELFGGYPWYHDHEILFREGFPWSQRLDIRRLILKAGVLPDGEDYVRQRYSDTVRNTEKLKTDSEITARMREMFMLNFYWFMQCLLDRKDRCSMYSGLEVRVPFCDYRIVDYAYNMPWEMKALGNREKGIVRKAFEDILPKDICYRKKSPYPKTHNPLYTELVSNRVREILNKQTVLCDLLDKSAILDIADNPGSIDSPWYGQLMRAPQILAYIIQLDFWFEEYSVSIV